MKCEGKITKCVFICLKLFFEAGEGRRGGGRANPVTRYLFHIVLFQIICSGLVPSYLKHTHTQQKQTNSPKTKMCK